MADSNTAIDDDIVEPSFKVNDIVILTHCVCSQDSKVTKVAYARKCQTFVYALDFRRVYTAENLTFDKQCLSLKQILTVGQRVLSLRRFRIGTDPGLDKGVVEARKHRNLEAQF